jgi:mono/diheme cytochrome c family protein
MRRKTNSVIKFAAVVAVFSGSVLAFVTMPRFSSAIDISLAQQATSGRELFMNNCARCHGDDAKGDKGPDLTSAKRQSKWAASEEPLINKINKGGLFMPKFGKKLSADEIKQIADYVRTLGK